MPGKLFKSAAIVGAAEANEIGFLKEPVSDLHCHMEAMDNGLHPEQTQTIRFEAELRPG